MKTALLIIDMQNDFLSPDSPRCMADVRRVIPAIVKLATMARKKGWSVIHVVRQHDSSGCDIEKFRLNLFESNPFLVEGTWGAGEVEELTPEPGDIVIGKTRFSAFMGTKLDLILRRLEIERLVICGAQYPNCIRATAVDGLSFDYDVAICPEATWGASQDVIDANIHDMRNMGIAFPSLGEIAAEK